MIKVPADFLHACLKVVSGTVPKKPTIEILKCLRIRVVNGDVILSSHDTQAGTSVVLGKADEQPQVVVDFAPILAFTNTLGRDDPDATLSWNEDQVQIECGSSIACWDTSDASIYPDLDPQIDTSLEPIPVPFMKQTLKFLLGVHESDVNTAISYELEDGLMGTSNNSEARFVRGFPKGEGRICIGNSHCKILKSFVGTCDDTDSLVPHMSGSNFMLQCVGTNRTVCVRTVEPSLVRKIPEKILGIKHDNQCTLKRALMVKLAKQAEVMSSSATSRTRLLMHDEVIQLIGERKSFVGEISDLESSHGEFSVPVSSEVISYVLANMHDVDLGIAAGQDNEPLIFVSGIQTAVVAPMVES